MTLTLALHPHVERRGYGADWGGFLQALTAHARQRGDVAAEAELALLRGAVQRQRGDHQGAMASYRRAWRLCRQTGDQLARARPLSNPGERREVRYDSLRRELAARRRELRRLTGE